jgi:hypothetical protein
LLEGFLNIKCHLLGGGLAIQKHGILGKLNKYP